MRWDLPLHRKTLASWCISNALLAKPGRPTPEEVYLIREHPPWGPVLAERGRHFDPWLLDRFLERTLGPAPAILCGAR